MKRTIIVTFILGLASLWVQGQTAADALRYSQIFNAGTARFVSMGGAFGALGGDFTTLSYNPAGIGVIRKTEFSFSPSLIYDKSSSNYLQNGREDFSYNFGFSQIGAITSLKSGSGVLKNLNFAFGYNQLNNFNQLVPIQGQRAVDDDRLGTSLVDYFMFNDYVGGNINGLDPEYLDSFWERLAFDAYVIDTIPGTQFDYFTEVPYGVNQKQIITRKGRNNEWVLSLGANFDHKFYLGATLGIQSIYYESYSDHTETWKDAGNDMFFTFSQELITRGTGVAFKMGAIYKPIELLRIGAAFHLPTFYSFDDEYYNTMESSYVSYRVVPTDQDGYDLPAGIAEYKIISPFRAIASIGLQFEKFGLLSLDYEFIDYSSARFRDDGTGDDFDPENAQIKDLYRPVSNIRAGGELRLGTFSLRGGYAFHASPYKSGTENEKASYSSLSAGLGIREKNFYFDLGYVHTGHDERYYLYEMEPDGAFLKSGNNRFITTIGFRF